jgi:hypothetical protein
MKRYLVIFALCAAAQGHDLITTKITWNREISRLLYARCVSCHRDGGRAFSLMTYQLARPWATAIKEEVLERRMPPWGAVKGFGDFRNDQALSQEQLELIAAWAEGGAPEGDEKDQPASSKPSPPLRVSPVRGGIDITGEFQLSRAVALDGLQPKSIPDGASFQITAERPDGSVEPLLWLNAYRTEFGHSFLLRAPLSLPAGTIIHGVPSGASITLMPRSGIAASKARVSAQTKASPVILPDAKNQH